MKGYLGTWTVNQYFTEFKNFKINDWAMYFIVQYGGIDDAHHKDWVLDQVTRILKGTKIIVEIDAWDNGLTEYRISTGKKSKYYQAYVKSIIDSNYEYNKGIAP